MGVFLPFLNCTNGIKSSKASHIINIVYLLKIVQDSISCPANSTMSGETIFLASLGYDVINYEGTFETVTKMWFDGFPKTLSNSF